MVIFHTVQLRSHDYIALYFLLSWLNFLVWCAGHQMNYSGRVCSSPVIERWGLSLFMSTLGRPFPLILAVECRSDIVPCQFWWLFLCSLGPGLPLLCKETQARWSSRGRICGERGGKEIGETDKWKTSEIRTSWRLRQAPNWRWLHRWHHPPLSNKSPPAELANPLNFKKNQIII